MKPLIVLLVSFVIATLVFYLIKKEINYAFSARVAMAIMLCFTAIGHFVYTEGMTMMIPSFIPQRTNIVFLTGVMEIVLGLSLLVPKFQPMSGWILIAFLILILPGNIYAAFNQINFQKATYDGPGLTYLWFRIPLQITFIVWTYLSTIK